MEDVRRVRAIVACFVKFWVLAPICLVAWWSVLPYYAQGLGLTTAGVLKYGLNKPIDEVEVDVQGLLNTKTTLKIITGSRVQTIELGLFVTNLAPFVALVLSTSRYLLRRKGVVFVVGAAILVVTHGFYVLLAYVFAPHVAKMPEVSTAIGQVFITLPFLLWIVLVWWEQLPKVSGPR